MGLIALSGPASQAEAASMESLLSTGLVLLLVPLLFAVMLAAVRWILVR